MAWDKTLPAGTTAIRASDDQIRANFAAIEEGGVPYDALKLSVQGSSPTAVADFGFLYTKDVSTKGELYYGDEDSNEVIMTSGGSLGSAATTVISSSAVLGSYTAESQPAFLVYNSSDDTGQVKGGAITVDFDTEVFDQGTDFASDTFTAPDTGRYLLSTTVTLSAINSATRFEIKIVTSNRTYQVASMNPVNALATGSDVVGASGSVIADMDATDTAIVQIIVDGGTSTYTIEGQSTLVTCFSGCRVA